MEIADRLTPIPEREFILIAARAWTKFYGSAPGVAQLSCCLSQMVLETGRERDPKRPGKYLWGKSAHNYNWGNIKHRGERDSFPHLQYYPAGEVIDGSHVMFYPKHAQTRFRAYLSAEDGMRDYIRFLVIERTRYAKAWSLGVLNGDPLRFSRELGLAGYYTAPIPRYTKTLVRLFAEFEEKVAEVLDSEEGQALFEPERRARRERTFALVVARMAELLRESFGEVDELDEDDATASITPNVPDALA